MNKLIFLFSIKTEKYNNKFCLDGEMNVENGGFSAK